MKPAPTPRRSKDAPGGASGARSRACWASAALGRPRTRYARRKSAGPCPLSFAQSRLWLAERITSGAGPIQHPAAYSAIKGALNVDALRSAFDALVARHEVLRTRFVLRDGLPQQIVAEHEPFALELLDLRRDPADAEPRSIRASSHAGQLRSRGRSDAARRASCGCATTKACSSSRSTISPPMDGRSKCSIVSSTALSAFDALLDPRAGPRANHRSARREGYSTEPAADPVLRLIPSGSARRCAARRSNGELAYWRRQLASLPPLELPTDRPRPAQSSFRGRRERFTVPAPLAAALKALVARAARRRCS